MPRYENGRIPRDALVLLGSGYDENGYWEWLLPPATERRFRDAQAYARHKWGKEPGISPGYNCYRPLAFQELAKRLYGPGAAAPGFSSHGGTFTIRGKFIDAMAIDVTRNGLEWWQVWEAFDAAGFITQYFNGKNGTVNEPWHMIDPDPLAAVPSGSNDTEFEGDSMSAEDVKDLKTYITQELKNFLSFKGADYTFPAVADSKLDGIAAQVASVQAGNIRFAPDAGYLLGPALAGVVREGDLPQQVTVDEEAIAKALAPLLPQYIGSLTDVDVQRLAVAASDEQAKRLARAPGA